MAEAKPNQKPKFKFSFDRLKPYIPKDYNDKMAEDYVTMNMRICIAAIANLQVEKSYKAVV